MRFDGRLRVECPWTSDPERLRRGVAAMLQRRAVARLGPPGNLINNPEGSPNRPDFDAMEATGHARGSLAALFDALRQFPEKPGRKALYFISDGGPFLAPQEISRDLIATSGSDATTQGGPDALRRARLETDRDDALLLDSLAWDRNRSASLLTDIARQAVLRDIEIHPVRSAPHDLGGLVSADRSFRARATVGGGRSLDPRSSRAATAPPTTDIAAGQGMEAVAETTGGDAVLSRRFFEDGLRREADNRDAVYALSFRDPHPGDHRFHSIEIISTRPGVHLRYRRGYRILDTREALIQASINRLYVADDENPLGVRLGFQALGVQEGRAAARITVAFPAPPEAGGGIGQAGAMEVLGICAVRDGVLSAPIDLSGKGEPSLVGEATWLTRSGTIRVKPGSYRWSFAIRDETTGITSYLTFDRALP
jgi:VWFA-related protein